MKRKYINIALTAIASWWSVSMNSQQTMSLQELYDLAEKESRQIHVSKIGLESASEAIDAAKSAMLPIVNLSMSESYIGNATLMSRGFSTSGTSDVIVAGLGPQKVTNGSQKTPHWGNSFTAQAYQMVYAGGAISAGIRLAELSRKMAFLDMEKNRQEVRFLLTGYFLDIYKIQNQLEVIDRNLELIERVMEQMKARHAEGMVLKRDITRYELQQQQMELTRKKLEDALEVINHQLVNTLHQPEDSQLLPDKGALDAAYQQLKNVYNQEMWQEIAYENHIGLRQTEVSADMAAEKMKTVKAGTRLNVSLVFEDNLFGPFTNDLIPVNSNVNVWYVGVGLKYNLSSLWTSKHKLAKARLDMMESQEKVSMVREEVENSIQACYVNFLTGYKEVSTAEKQVELANENYSVVEKRYHNGLSLLTDMLDASVTKFATEMDLVNAHLNMLYNYYKLKYVSCTL